MRLWHKDLIPVLPEMQLRRQWRECVLIAKALHENNLNHVLVNRVKDYPTVEYDDIFKDWHDKRYLRQCLYNLEEKAIAGGIPYQEWLKIVDKFGNEFDLWE